jgi:hypothetical protein
MAIFTSRKQKKDIKVTFVKETLYVEIDGGKQQAFPLAWFPALQNASDEDKQDWTLTANGIHWNKLNIDIALTGL